MKTAEQLASTLHFLVERGIVPGLLPKDVLAAADMIVAQKAEIESLTATHPRRYFSEMRADARTLQNPDYLSHASRQMARTATAEWMQEIEQKCHIALVNAVKAETAK